MISTKRQIDYLELVYDEAVKLMTEKPKPMLKLGICRHLNMMPAQELNPVNDKFPVYKDDEDWSERELPAINDMLCEMMTSWVHYSGNHKFPVPSNLDEFPKLNMCPRETYFKCSPSRFYDNNTQYGKARLNLLDRIIRGLELEIHMAKNRLTHNGA